MFGVRAAQKAGGQKSLTPGHPEAAQTPRHWRFSAGRQKTMYWTWTWPRGQPLVRPPRWSLVKVGEGIVCPSRPGRTKTLPQGVR